MIAVLLFAGIAAFSVALLGLVWLLDHLGVPGDPENGPWP